MKPPHNDDAPDLHPDVEYAVAEILEEIEPKTAADFDRLANLTMDGASTFDGGREVAKAVAAELRRRAKAMRDAGG